MTGKTHLTAGMLAAVYISKKTNLPFNDVITCCSLSSLGALFPDIDLASSKLGSKVKIISKPINKFFGHRTFFHAPIIYTIVYIILNSFFPENINYFNYFFVGVATHIGLDLLNKKGIPLFYPIYRKRFHLATIKTQGKMEYVLNGIFLIFICLLLVQDTKIGNNLVSYITTLNIF